MTKELILAPRFTPGDLIRPDGTLQLPPDWIDRKNALLAEAATTTLPANTHDRDVAISVAARIKGEIDDIEEARERDKSGYYKMCCAIDLTKKLHVKELEAERARINREVGAFNEGLRIIAQREQDARDRAAAELQRKAREEQEALERKLEEERKIAAAAEAKRKAQEEAAAKKGKELTDAQKAKRLEAQLAEQERLELIENERQVAQANLDRQKAELEKGQLEAAERQRQERATGGSQLTKINIEVTDAKLLYAKHPSCVKLVPDVNAIKFLINTHKNEPDFRIPGVIFSKHAEFSPKGR